MASCLAGVAYTMKADVFQQQITYDENTNETLTRWVFYKTIKCLVTPYLDGGIKGAGTRESFGEQYVNADYVRLKSQHILSKADQVSNIRHAKTGEILWADEEIDNKPTNFNVDGTSPIINPLTGRPTEYLSTLSRAEVRSIGNKRSIADGYVPCPSYCRNIVAGNGNDPSRRTDQ